MGYRNVIATLLYPFDTITMLPMQHQTLKVFGVAVEAGIQLYLHILRGVAQPGSALAWGARGRGFESRRPDQLKEPSALGNSVPKSKALFLSFLKHVLNYAVLGDFLAGLNLLDWQ